MSTVNPALLNFIKREREERSDSGFLIFLPDQELVGFCAVNSGKWGKKHNGTERKIISTEGLKCLSTAKFGFLIFENSCCSFIGINKTNQTIMTHPQQIMLIFCVISMLPTNALCIYVGI